MHRCLQEGGQASVNTSERVVELLTRIRDARVVWDVMGPMYNRRIHEATAGLIDRVDAEIQLPPGARLLDAGCGPGHAALQLAGDNPDATVLGIDYSSSQVRAAKRLQRERGITNCVFERANVMKIRRAEGSFDAAVSIGSVKHWPDAIRGLSEIHRVLKTDGVLLVSDTDQGASDDDIRLFMTRFRVWFVPEGVFFWGLRNVVFGRSFTRASLADAVRRAGFRDIETSRALDCPYVIVKARK